MAHLAADRLADSEYSDNEIRSIKRYQGSHLGISLFQIVSTIGLLLACYILLYAGLTHGWWGVLVLAPLASGLSIRTFVLQHDCGHGSLFRSRWANDLAGRVCSLLTLTPYDHWKKHHGLHHGSWNNMDTRGRLSDLYSDCITVAEYRQMTRLKQSLYRISKNPILNVFVMPPVIFFIVYRIAFDTPRHWVRERLGVYLTNLCLLCGYGALVWFAGIKFVALVSFMVIYPAAVIGAWMFLVQHKFEGVQWVQNPQWNTFDAALTGCSFMRLSRVWRWFTGDIGTHHVHHAAPGIPNYRLVDCHNAHQVFQNVKILTWRDGVREARLNVLWDEETRTMVDLRSVT
ncbi:fatty acid desaturase family protein [Gluconacetobacter takamatsuzukensis]|uniref:Fatty acid desaturase n=1 Tax=Gluconacetobacter takamatsuzukensis TaxID=1286190 RepID=A0A7W4KF12_9PROT|nr:fatty acid desaturase [Gluconacetobacter takamatsuzukensis]MBB2205635.1 fatty acid desaturase [Gluconacetobacter takamatsuzukensis]